MSLPVPTRAADGTATAPELVRALRQWRQLPVVRARSRASNSNWQAKFGFELLRDTRRTGRRLNSAAAEAHRPTHLYLHCTHCAGAARAEVHDENTIGLLANELDPYARTRVCTIAPVTGDCDKSVQLVGRLLLLAIVFSAQRQRARRKGTHTKTLTQRTQLWFLIDISATWVFTVFTTPTPAPTTTAADVFAWRLTRRRSLLPLRWAAVVDRIALPIGSVLSREPETTAAAKLPLGSNSDRFRFGHNSLAGPFCSRVRFRHAAR